MRRLLLGILIVVGLVSPAQAALEFSHGAILWPAATTATTALTAISGLAFQPKAIRFYWVGGSAAVGSDFASDSTDHRAGIGCATSTSNRRAVGVYSDDNPAGSSNTGSGWSEAAAVITVDSTGAIDGALDLTTVASDGFTLTVDDQGVVDVIVFWEAWGGADVTVAACGSIAEPAATGTQSYSVTGFTDEATDQVVMLAGIQATAAAEAGTDTGSGLMVGVATEEVGNDAAQSWVIVANAEENVATTDTDSYRKSGEVLAMLPPDGAAGSVTARATLSDWATDAFVLDWTERATTNRRYIFLAIKGGKWKAGESTIDATTLNATSGPHDVDFNIIGLSVVSSLAAENSSDSSGSTASMSIGTGTSTTSRRSMFYRDQNGVATANVNMAIQYDEIISWSTGAALCGGADVSSISNEEFTLIVDDDCAGANAATWFGYLTYGSAIPAGGSTKHVIGGGLGGSNYVIH